MDGGIRQVGRKKEGASTLTSRVEAGKSEGRG
jgi:hypothetical protein